MVMAGFMEAGAVTISGGASLVPDAFSVAGRTDVVGGAAGIFVRMGAVANPVDLHRGPGTNNEGYQLAVTNTDYLPPVPPYGTVTYTVPAPVQVGTIFAYHWVDTTNAVNGPFDVSLDGSNVLSLPGTRDAVARLTITTLPPGLSASQMQHQVAFSQVTGYSPNGEVYGSSPRTWETITERTAPIAVDPAGVAANYSCDWPSATAYTNLVNKNGDGTYAWSQGAYWDNTHSPGIEITLNLGDPGSTADTFEVGALLLATRGDHDPDMDIFYDDGAAWQPVAHVLGSGGAEEEFFIARFTAPVTTGRLLFREAASSSLLLYKAIPLEILAVPEPATGVLLLASLVGYGRRPRRRLS